MKIADECGGLSPSLHPPSQGIICYSYAHNYQVFICMEHYGHENEQVLVKVNKMICVATLSVFA